MSINFRLTSNFHDLTGRYPTIKAARKAQADHRAECACGAGIKACGTREALLAAGAYEPMYAHMCVELYLPDPEGGYPISCEVDEDDEDDEDEEDE